jgi:hypothetical protein
VAAKLTEEVLNRLLASKHLLANIGVLSPHSDGLAAPQVRLAVTGASRFAERHLRRSSSISPT